MVAGYLFFDVNIKIFFCSELQYFLQLFLTFRANKIYLKSGFSHLFCIFKDVATKLMSFYLQQLKPTNETIYKFNSSAFIFKPQKQTLNVAATKKNIKINNHKKVTTKYFVSFNTSRRKKLKRRTHLSNTKENITRFYGRIKQYQTFSWVLQTMYDGQSVYEIVHLIGLKNSTRQNGNKCSLNEALRGHISLSHAS